MTDEQYNVLVFGFTENNELWEHIVHIIDLNIKAETELATGLEVSGEQRIHACGRAQAWQDIKTLLFSERKKGLEAKGISSKKTA